MAEEMGEDAMRTLVILHQQGEQITRTHMVATDINHDFSRRLILAEVLTWKSTAMNVPLSAAIFLLLLIAAPDAQSSLPATDETSSTIYHNELSSPTHIQRSHHNSPSPLPPPPPLQDQIDVRLADQKRLVPGGPNPLHN
ncbi:hypothetical protein NMG60_11009664 [Bertholletia excelsa]